MTSKSRKEMEAIALEMFGGAAVVEWHSDADCWVVVTGIEEAFDPEPYKDTPAYEMYNTHDASHGDALARFAWKNGMSGMDMEQTFINTNMILSHPDPARYKTQTAKDAAKSYERAYCDYLEQSTLELAARFPDRAEYFMTRSLSEALAGNDGD